MEIKKPNQDSCLKGELFSFYTECRSLFQQIRKWLIVTEDFHQGEFYLEIFKAEVIM